MKSHMFEPQTVSNEQKYYNALKAAITVDGNMLCLGQLLQRSASIFSASTALIWQDRSISYKELYYRTILLSNVLRKKGLQAGDRALLFFENSVEFYIGYFAAVQVGAVIAPLNTFLQQTELAHIVNDAQPSLIITASTHVDLFNAVLPSGHMIHIITEHDMDTQSLVPEVLPEFQVTHLDQHQMAALLYTSGTTGLPKGVMLSSKNIMTNIIQALSRSRMDEKERVLGVLPLFHSFAQNVCVWSSMFIGFSVILVPKIDRRNILQGLRHKPTIFFGVPALYGFLCLLKTAEFPDVKFFVCGGDVLPDKIRAGFALIYRRNICNGYGLTEATPFVSVDLEDVIEPTSCIGRPFIGLQAEIVDQSGNVMPQNTVGELRLKGDNVMLGYYNAPDMTAQTIKNGWLYTGDLAYIDAHGKIVITGRIKDLIIHKGFNIYPAEIENIILSHPHVIRAAVVGHMQEMEEVPVAFVQLKIEQPDIERALKKLCATHLASYKVPREFYISTEDLPATATGKVDKKVLRKKLDEAKKN